MKLYSGSTYWPETVMPVRNQAVMPLHSACDVLVVGSGVTGAMVAYELAQAGLEVIVVDRRELSSGSTVASTALIQYEIDTRMLDLADKIGMEKAQSAYLACRQGLHDMITLVGELETDCDLTARPSLYLARRASEAAVLRAEAKARQKIGLVVDYLDATALEARYGIRRPGALLSGLGMEVNPLRLTHALLNAASELGAKIYSKVRVHPPKQRGGVHVVTAEGGQTIVCHHVVMATGYEATEQYRSVKKMTTLKTTFAAVTTPVPGSPWPGGALIWETGSPYFYARTAPNGGVMMGGLDTDLAGEPAREAVIRRNSKRLVATLQNLFPELVTDVQHAWSGTFAETSDGLPYIGELPGHPKVHFALGYGGNGLTFSILAAQIIRDRIAGCDNQMASLFAFDR